VGTKSGKRKSKKGYDPSKFPAFAVTVDVIVLTIAAGRLRVLLVRRGSEPYKGRWAIPGGFKRPDETLEEAARRELVEEASVETAGPLTQFGAYGDPGRDPRMNVVSVAHLAVLSELGDLLAGDDAAGVALVPVAEALAGSLDLAFDHARILADAVERVRADLDLTGIATAFVGPTFTLAELREVYEAAWDVRLDAANFRRRVLAEDGWVIPTRRQARPGSTGGKPAELFRAGERWQQGSPVRRSRPNVRRLSQPSPARPRPRGRHGA
jgi:8-oxo-dGTP diphosphatase